jgi:O-antigen ligase
MGLLGLSAFYGATLLPILLLRRRARPVTWDAPLVAGASALAVALGLHAIDNLFNAMSNPFFLLAMGGLTGLAADARQTLPAEFSALSRPVPSQNHIATAPRMPVPAAAASRPTRAPDATDEELICEDLPDRPPEAS